MADLNPSQRAAVQTLAGPLLVLAGAGSGKTRVITFRIAELIRHGTPADRILAVTFTNKAAKEMRERAMTLLGTGRRKKGQPTPEISTFHSLCVRILRRRAHHLGYPRDFVIYDRGDQESVARAALREVRVAQNQLTPGDFLQIVGGWKTHSIRPAQAHEVATSDAQQHAAAAYERYQNSLLAFGAMDFDDLLMVTERLFDEYPEVRHAESSRFDHLLIDEYQDTNGLQYRIVKALADRHRNICVVGDDDQSIYGWRGAEVSHILSFARDWPDAKVVKLEENYRSSASILDLANTLIRHNSNRHDKTLRAFRPKGDPPRFVAFEDEVAEAGAVARDIAQKIGEEAENRVSPSDIAILYRTNEQPRALETELRKHKVPYVLVGGLSFYDRKEVRDILAYLRVLAQPNDEVSLLRVLNTPPRGIGTGSVQTLLAHAVERAAPLWVVLPDATVLPDLPHNVGERVEAFRQLVVRYRERMESTPLPDLVRELVAEVNYRAELQRLYKDEADVAARWAAVEEVVNAIAQYAESSSEPTLLGFLEETALSGKEDNRESDKDKKQARAVTLQTLHSAKGLEFPHVYMIGMEEGLLPHQRSVVEGGEQIAEERRLGYVGVTRAQDHLTLSFAKNRMKWGKLKPSIPSRFLMEMRGETERAKRAAEASRKRFVEGTEEAAEGSEAPAAAAATATAETAGRGKKGSAKAPKARSSTASASRSGATSTGRSKAKPATPRPRGKLPRLG